MIPIVYHGLRVIFCCSDGYHVSVDTVHPCISASVFLFFFYQVIPSPKSSFRCVLGLVSSRFQTTSVSFFAPHVMFYTSSLSLMHYFITWSLSGWPFAHLHIFISFTSNFFTWELVINTVSIPYRTTTLWIFLLTRAWWYPLVAYDSWNHPPVVPSSLCPLVFFCMHVSIALQGAPIYIYRHMYSALLLTLSVLSSPRVPCIVPIPSPARISPLRTAPHHPRTSSAKFLIFVSESIVMAHRNELKSDPRWRPTSTAKWFACSCSTHHCSFALMVHALRHSDVLLWYPLVSHAPILFTPRSVSLAVLLCIFLAAVLAQK